MDPERADYLDYDHAGDTVPRADWVLVTLYAGLVVSLIAFAAVAFFLVRLFADPPVLRN